LFINLYSLYGLSVIFNIDVKNYVVIVVKWVENEEFIVLKKKSLTNSYICGGGGANWA